MLVATYFLRTGRPLAAQLAVLLLFFPIAVHELREVGKDAVLAALCLFWFGVFLHRARQRRAFSLIEALALAGIMVLLIDIAAERDLRGPAAAAAGSSGGVGDRALAHGRAVSRWRCSCLASPTGPGRRSIG